MKLLRSRHFAPLMGVQTLAALNDNFIRQGASLWLVTLGAASSGLPAGVLNSLAAAVFVLPFIVLSAQAGWWADTQDKAVLVRWVKLVEVAIVLLMALALWQASVVGVLLSLLLLGAHAAVFGPVKFALLPAHLPPDHWLPANAWLETGTFAGILLGVVVAPWLWQLDVVGWWLMAMLVALLGWFLARAIPPAPALRQGSGLHWHPWRLTRQVLALAWRRAQRRRLLGLISLFWALGVVWLTGLPVLVLDQWHAGAGVYAALLGLFTLGVALGAQLAAGLARRWSGRRQIALGLWLLALSGSWLALTMPSHWSGWTNVGWALGWLTLGVGGSLLAVPAYVLLLVAAPRKATARVMAANNILNALAMLGISVLAMLMLGLVSGSLSDWWLMVSLLGLAGLLMLPAEAQTPTGISCPPAPGSDPSVG